MSRLVHFLTLAFFALLLLFPLIPQAQADDPVKGPAAPRMRPPAAQQPLADDGQMRIGPQDRCPVCGMLPSKRLQTATAMVLADGRTYYFCGNGCLLLTWHNTATYLNVPRERIQRMVVQDYFSGTPLDARVALWVAGSDVIGPMGKALVALSTEAEVARFKERHGGTRVFQLSEMDDALWAALFPPQQ
jgi:copper chaperone NosL